MTKKVEILIVVAILIALAFITGCKDEAEANEPKNNYGYIEWNCSCGKHLGCTYIKPHYWFECATCGTIKTNTECETTEEFYELVGFEERFVEPNEPTMTESEVVPFPEDISGGLLDFIPTWPDYIELEKDLYITPPDAAKENWYMYIEKGTKIYFKD